MKNKNGIITVLLIVILGAILIKFTTSNHKKDEWHNFDGSEIVCRVSGCGNRPLYSDWDNRFCAEHIDRSADHSSSYNHSSVTKKKVNTEKALTMEEANSLRGTGYNGTRPY